MIGIWEVIARKLERRCGDLTKHRGISREENIANMYENYESLAGKHILCRIRFDAACTCMYLSLALTLKTHVMSSKSDAAVYLD